LKLYDIPTAGYSWAGEADMNGLNSNIRVNFPEDGLYEFSADALSGSFQFLVNNDFIQKTVESASTVTYFVPAGTHALTIDQETNSNSDWSLDVSNVGDSHDSLPYEKMGGQIGGTGNDFTTEWLPINLSAATEVNIATTFDGAATDDVLLTVLDENDAVIDTLTVYGEETTWMTLDLPAGTSRLKLDAAGNTGWSDYEIYVSTIPSAAAYTWDGNAIDIGANSHIRVSFPTSGVYSFTQSIDLGNGRFQFLINDDYVQKTIETSETTTYFIPAGTHDLVIDQDSTLGADWQVAMSGPVAAMDTLPYTQMGGELGGAGNDFMQEWLPVHVGTDTPVNAVIDIVGDSADAVTVEVWDASSKVAEIGPIYGTESLWATFTLPADGRLYLVANGGNATEVSYEVEIIEIPGPTFSWGGTSLDGTENSVIEVDLQVSGIYTIEGDFLEGFASIAIDPPTSLTSVQNTPNSIDADFTIVVDLDAGTHTFAVMQGNFPTSTWAYTITLATADPPTISSVTPDVVSAGKQTTITINGTNFMDDAGVTLIGDTDYPLATTYVSSTQLTAVVPATVAIDLYDVQVTNPDTQSATLTDGLEVIEYYIFLPVIMKAD
jgi:hypothetical protein